MAILVAFKIKFNKISQMEQDDQFPYHGLYDWKSKTFLGEGSYGKVYKVKNTKDGQFYAIKQMKMEEFNRDQTLMASLKGQIQITMDVNSEHTVKMLDAKIGKNYTYMILQLCDSDLRKELASRKFTQEECVHAFQEILQGFQILVHKGYIHRDVKPANTLVKNKIYKVADFGFACKADILGKKKLTDICGTPIYMAPQLLKNQPYTAKSDIWSLGLMLYEMIFGFAPWPCRSLEQYLGGICNKPLSFPFNAQIGQNTKDFLLKSLVVDEEKRMGWQDVFSHPLVKHKQVGENIEQINIDPYVRQVLLKIQDFIIKNNVKWGNIKDKYSNQVIDFNVFQKFIKDIEPSITTHQSFLVFQFIDKKKSKVITWQKLEYNLIMIDYRSYDDVFSRKVDEIVAIIRERKIDPAVVFEQIDLNHSGSLDFTEFSKFITAIAPCYTKAQVLQLYKLFDSDKNGLISKLQFLEFLTKRLPSKRVHSYQSIQRERATRNIQQLVGYLKWSGINSNGVFNLADRDHSQTIQPAQFEDLMVSKLKFKISKQEIQELFAVINKSQTGKLTVKELSTILN